MNEFFSGKTQELGKGLFFENAFEIKPTNSIATSTRAMKMKFYGYWENLCSGELGRELSVNRVSRPGRFPGIAGTQDITEMTENFTKVTKYLNKFKETLINYVWEKSHFKKQ